MKHISGDWSDKASQAKRGVIGTHSVWVDPGALEVVVEVVVVEDEDEDVELTVPDDPVPVTVILHDPVPRAVAQSSLPPEA